MPRSDKPRGPGGRYLARGEARYIVWEDPTILFHLYVHGLPKPWAAPVMSRYGGEVPTPARQSMRNWQWSVEKAWREVVRPGAPFDGPLSMRAVYMLVKPKSRPKAEVWAVTFADLDNIAKATHDALQRCGALVNDARIVELYAAKVWVDTELDQGMRLELRRAGTDLAHTLAENHLFPTVESGP